MPPFMISFLIFRFMTIVRLRNSRPAMRALSVIRSRAQRTSRDVQRPSSNIPFVPSTAHIHPTEVALSSFFAMHRPLEILHHQSSPSAQKPIIKLLRSAGRTISDGESLRGIQMLSPIALKAMLPGMDIDEQSGQDVNIFVVHGGRAEEAIEEEGENTEVMEVTSVKRKRKLKMNKHKYKKRRKAQRSLRRRIGRL